MRKDEIMMICGLAMCVAYHTILIVIALMHDEERRGGKNLPAAVTAYGAVVVFVTWLTESLVATFAWVAATAVALALLYLFVRWSSRKGRRQQVAMRRRRVAVVADAPVREAETPVEVDVA